MNQLSPAVYHLSLTTTDGYMEALSFLNRVVSNQAIYSIPKHKGKTMTKPILITHRSPAPTTAQKLLAAMESAAKTDQITTIVIHVGDAEGEQAVREELRLLTPQRTEMMLDMALNPRTYHNGARVLEIAFEDYVIRNGWRRDYVDMAVWKAEELRFAGLNAS